MANVSYEIKVWGPHAELKRQIDAMFDNEHDQEVAWKTVGIIKDILPNFLIKLDGMFNHYKNFALYIHDQIDSLARGEEK